MIEIGPFASKVHHSLVALRIFGDDLVPGEITALLGTSPTKAVIKGEKGKHIVGPKVGDLRVAKSGMWTLDAPDREPEDMNGQIREILSQMTDDLAIWQRIVKRYRVDLFCGLFLSDDYGGLTLSPQSLVALGERGIKMSLCIYGECREIRPAEPCPCKSGKSYADAALQNQRADLCSSKHAVGGSGDAGWVMRVKDMPPL